MNTFVEIKHKSGEVLMKRLLQGKCWQKSMGGGSTSNIDVDDINDVNICDFMPDDNEPNNEREDVAGIFKTLQNILLTLMQLSIIIFIVVHIYATFYDPHRQYFPKSPIYAGKSSSDELKSYDNQLPGDSVMHNNISDLKKQISELLGELADIKAFMNDTANWRSSIEKKLTVSVTSSNRSADFSVEDKIRNALKLYDADKLGIADYALESSGGSVVSTPETIPYPSNIVYELFGFIPLKSISNPNFAIQPYNSPGQCFAFYGSKGKIRIHLAKRISITNFTIEHVNSNLVDDISSAPKEMIVYGLNDLDSSDSLQELASYVYDPKKEPIQTFPVYESSPRYSFENVELHVLSNYGNEQFTCIYRFRVHGVKEDA